MEEQSNCCGACRLWETDICSYCKEHADFSDWEDEANERMKIIAQNGNDGLHYRDSIIDKVKEIWDSIKLIRR